MGRKKSSRASREEDKLRKRMQRSDTVRQYTSSTLNDTVSQEQSPELSLDITVTCDLPVQQNVATSSTIKHKDATVDSASVSNDNFSKQISEKGESRQYQSSVGAFSNRSDKQHCMDDQYSEKQKTVKLTFQTTCTGKKQLSYGKEDLYLHSNEGQIPYRRKPDSISSNTLSDSTMSQLERKRQQYRTKYHTDKAFRENKLRKSKERYYKLNKTSTAVQHKESERQKLVYASDEIYRQSKLNFSKTKYRDNLQHQQAKKSASNSKYRDNLQHREALQQYSKSKYKDNLQHQEAVKQFSKAKYRDNSQHREVVQQYSKSKYRDNSPHREVVQQYSKSKYRDNSQHREVVQQYSKSKYRDNSQHREVVQQYSKSKYRDNSQHREVVQQYSKSKYRDNSQHREVVQQYSKSKYRDNSQHREVVQQYSKSKYRDNSQHREVVQQYSKSKYRDNSQHREVVQQYSKSKYRDNSQHREVVQQYSKSKYRENSQHREALQQYSKSKYRSNLQHREELKQYSRSKYRDNSQRREALQHYSKSKYRENMQHRAALQQYSKFKYRENMQFRESVKSSSTLKYRSNAEFRQSVKIASITKYSQNAQHRESVKKRSKDKYRHDLQHRTRVKTLKRLKYSRNKLYREHILCMKRSHYRTNVSVRQHKIQLILQSRLSAKDEKQIISSFREEISKSPRYVCCVCQKLLWREQCIICHPDHYVEKSTDSGTMAAQCITTQYLHTCNETCDELCDIAASHKGKLWICYTCHRKLLKGQMPSDAQQNNLKPLPVPEELNDLNEIEKHLISLRIPFMKMVSLPKGGQKGIIGPCVSVPTDVQKTTEILPRSDNDSELIKVKLKRKLPYKGHYKYHFVRTKKLKTALDYLKAKNKWYENIEIDQSWENPVENPCETSDLDDTDDSVDDEIDCNSQKDNTNQQSTDETSVSKQKQKTTESMEGVPIDTCLQPCDVGQEVMDQYFEDIFCVAPGENNTPVSLLKEEGNEAMSFPTLFPDGKASLSDDRKVPITSLRYFHNRLLNADTRFAEDTSYIFYAQYVSELQQVVSNVSIALRKSTDKDKHGANITPERITDNTSLRNLLSNDQGYKFLKPVRGTPPYWQTTMKDLFAMIRQKGIPTWFCTFSSADMRWPEIINAILEQEDSTLKAEELDWTCKCEVLSRNPVMSAIMYNRRFNIFLKKVIMCDQSPIGEVQHRFHRIEFQKRGSPHSHCTFWIKDSPKLDINDDQTICDFIDRYVTCHLPSIEEDEELHEIVSAVQQHSKSHSKSCRKKGTTCRFNFPRPPSGRTFISRTKSVTDPSSDKSSEQEIRDAKEILQRLWDIIMDPELDIYDITTETLFQHAGVTQELYEHASNVMTKRTSIVLQRSPGNIWINQYNPTLLKCWNGNMDIQYILDAYSCVMYIISYISKAESELGMILEETRKEAAEGNDNAEQAMKKIGTSYFRNREVCVQEAVYRVCGLHLKECSCKVQFLPVGENPVRMSLPLHVIQSKSKDMDSESMWMKSLYDKYKARPDNEMFATMSYAMFSSKFNMLSPSQVPKKPSSSVYSLQDNMGYIRERTKTGPAVVRYPRFSLQKNPEMYYQSVLQLFLPHRTAKQLKPDKYQSYEEFYKSGAVKLSSSSEVTSVYTIVEEQKSIFEKDADILDEAKEIMEKAGPFEDAWASLAAETERERLESGIETICTTTDEDLAEGDIPDLHGHKEKGAIEIAKQLFKKDEILPLLRSLNDTQKEIFYYVRRWCLDKINGKNPKPFHLFITGGAGTGKSHLVKCLFYEVQKLLSPLSSSPDNIVALLTAPTGTAAYNIRGTTLHSAFSLSKYLSLPYKSLRDDSINSLRATLQHLQILFIDEISMVDKKLLMYVSERLRQIKVSKSSCIPFGGVSVITVGDFYQLPPVRQSSLLKKDQRQPINLFTDYFKLVELTKVMRQRDDREFADMLNRLRVRKKGEALLPSDLEKLQNCETRYTESEALHVLPTNNEVNDHNFRIAYKTLDVAMNIIAHDYKKDITTGKQTRVEVNFETKSGNLPKDLFIGIGARVMLIRNIDIEHGLVNGAFGTVQKILHSKSEDMLQEGILVEFDNSSVQIEGSSSAATLIKPIFEDLGVRSKVRHQFPLVPAWACTVHKVQGATANAITTSLKKVFSPGQAYVALSRCTTLQGLTIKDLNVDNIYCDASVPSALEKMEHFPLDKHKAAESRSVTLCLHNIQGLFPHLLDLQSNNCAHADYICLTETWLTKTDNTPAFSHYNFHHRTRYESYDTSEQLYKQLKLQNRGGVGVFSKDFDNIVELNVHNIEFVAFSIADLSTLVVVIYRPETLPVRKFLQTLQELILTIQSSHQSVLLIGDFNENLLQSHCPIKAFLHQRGFKQLLTQPTTDGDTLIDHVYCNSDLCIDIDSVQTYYSYHNMIKIGLSKNIEIQEDRNS